VIEELRHPLVVHQLEALRDDVAPTAAEILRRRRRLLRSPLDGGREGAVVRAVRLLLADHLLAVRRPHAHSAAPETVLSHDRDRRGAQALAEQPCHPALARARGAREADDHRPCLRHS